MRLAEDIAAEADGDSKKGVRIAQRETLLFAKDVARALCKPIQPDSYQIDLEEFEKVIESKIREVGRP